MTRWDGSNLAQGSASAKGDALAFVVARLASRPQKKIVSAPPVDQHHLIDELGRLAEQAAVLGRQLGARFADHILGNYILNSL